MGWLRLAGQRAGLYENELGVAIFVIANVLALALLIWWNARQLFAADLQRLDAENQLRHVATHDRLTGLANRGFFMDRLTHRINLEQRRPVAPFAVLYMDLDGFKQVNDKMGHAAGDVLLQEVAQILKKCSRMTDLAARLGGDEFTILAEELARPDDARVLAERILATLPRAYAADGQATPIGISIGIALHEAGVTSADEMLRNADTALYQAKRGGKGCFAIYNPSDSQQTEPRRGTSTPLAPMA
nr:GGDEF domain-containing protein [Pseudoduganella ginsengisoli]